MRTADAIATNIAEGSAKNRAEFARYLDIALGASSELENHLMRARDAGLMPPREANLLIERTDHVRRKVIRLVTRVRRRPR